MIQLCNLDLTCRKKITSTKLSIMIVSLVNSIRVFVNSPISIWVPYSIFLEKTFEN